MIQGDLVIGHQLLIIFELFNDILSSLIDVFEGLLFINVFFAATADLVLFIIAIGILDALEFLKNLVIL